jgi:FkbM family methyltransferase
MNSVTRFRSEHFSLRHRVVSFISRSLFGSYTYTIRHGLATGMRRKGGLGFLPFDSGETAETRFLRALRLEGKVVYDIGAFEGVLTLFFASRARQVITYEPNPRNYAKCMENVRLNRLENVRILNRGVSDTAGSIEMIYDPLMPGAGSGEKAIADQIGSSVKAAQRLSIPVVPLDRDIAENGLPAPDFIKIDIEGMEFPALNGMRGTLEALHPALYIEMHGATAHEKLLNSQAVVKFLDEVGYRIHDVEEGDDLTPATLGNRCPSHLYCTV